MAAHLTVVQIRKKKKASNYTCYNQPSYLHSAEAMSGGEKSERKDSDPVMMLIQTGSLTFHF